MNLVFFFCGVSTSVHSSLLQYKTHFYTWPTTLAICNNKTEEAKQKIVIKEKEAETLASGFSLRTKLGKKKLLRTAGRSWEIT